MAVDAVRLFVHGIALGRSIFRFFEPTTGVDANKNLIDITLANKVRWGPGDSPFNIVLANGGCANREAAWGSS